MTLYKCVVLLLLLYILPCKAFVDNYKWSYPGAEAAMEEIAKERDSFVDERSARLMCYTGDKGQTCQKKALKHDISSVVLTNKMIQLRQALKGIDQQIAGEIQKCNGDEQCMDDATNKASQRVEEFKTQAISDVKTIKQTYLTNITEFMDKCITEE